MVCGQCPPYGLLPTQKKFKMSSILVRQAISDDRLTVLDILTEAALWLEQKNMPLWGKTEISAAVVSQDIESGCFYIAFAEGCAAGVVKFQTEDLLFWPDISQSESAFLHRLAVRRSFGGGVISSAIMSWAVDRSRELGKQYLRLDCVADRSRLRSIYENFGFQYHSDRQVGPHFVARYEYKL
jgi:GNAT superfamily N-acetyltransferase